MLLEAWERLHPLWHYVLGAGGAIGWIYGAYERLRRRRAEKRAQGPYLVLRNCSARPIPDKARFLDMNKYEDQLDGFFADFGSHGIEMCLGFENLKARVIEASIDGPRFSLVGTNGQIIEGISKGWIRYVYEHSRKGRPERFKLRFQTMDGYKLTHVYETVHGKPFLERVKPA